MTSVTAGTGADTDVVLLGLSSMVVGFDGDYNDDSKVDAADYVVWRENVGTTNLLPHDPHGGTIGPDQYDTWRSNFGKMVGNSAALAAVSVPEPGSVLLVILSMIALYLFRVR